MPVRGKGGNDLPLSPDFDIRVAWYDGHRPLVLTGVLNDLLLLPIVGIDIKDLVLVGRNEIPEYFPGFLHPGHPLILEAILVQKIFLNTGTFPVGEGAIVDLYFGDEALPIIAILSPAAAYGRVLPVDTAVACGTVSRNSIDIGAHSGTIIGKGENMGTRLRSKGTIVIG